MVEPADLQDLDDVTGRRRGDRPCVGSVLVEREVRSRPVIVREVMGEDTAQVPFAEDKDMIEALAPHRADQPLHERILPRTVGRCEDFIDGDQARTWLARNVRHGWDGGVRRFGSSLETVRSETPIPNLRSSPWILGAPHHGLAAAIRGTGALISAVTDARLIMGRPESLVQ